VNNDQMIAEWAEDGWYPLLVGLEFKLEMVVPGYQLDAIEEAFGSMRVFISQGECNQGIWSIWYSQAEGLLMEAEYLSESVAR